MRLRIVHTTSFAYDSPIVEAHTELRLRPLDRAGQHCLSFRVDTEPPGVRLRTYPDPLGNQVHHFELLEPHHHLSVTAASEVDTPPAYVDTGPPSTLLELYDYGAPTEYADFTDTVRSFAREHAGEGTSRQRAARLGSAIFRELVYEPGVTHVGTPAHEALELRRGVCQDFAHLMLAACRSLGMRARYVSGYLHDPTLVGANAASHAWVDVLDELRGWVSFDPTHDREQTEEYVRVAVGRDYADVPPTRGVYKGTAVETLDARVAVEAL